MNQRERGRRRRPSRRPRGDRGGDGDGRPQQSGEQEVPPDGQTTTVFGLLDMTGRGGGFLRRRDAGYLPTKYDVHVPPRIIERLGLRKGDVVEGDAAAAGKGGRGLILRQATQVNGHPAAEAMGRPHFTDLGAVHPFAPLALECDIRRNGQPDYTNRIMDLLCPLGKGQRALVVSPAKAGKTTVLQSLCEGVVRNHPDIELLILLVDERPEEVTEMEMCGFGEVIASSFDFPAERHTALAELTLERARRQVELGRDVVLVLDSITRLARAYNTVEKGTGRTLTGGLDAGSMEEPKRFLGSARAVDPKRGGGSLTIIGTALVDTGSKMDTVIFEEFKGTGNSEVVLSRDLSERRIYPAIDLNASATRREELLLTPEALKISHALRNLLARLSPVEAMNELLAMMKRSPSLDEIARFVA
ncbi:MAG: transcription termination factor Rho [Gemmatimonadota bacterium]|nr:transcription termination factor Rho [Gemmatimonadota bacterium]MDH5199031.1 transcription termination factor Rho [Gemmatimonadota bacterium]